MKSWEKLLPINIVLSTVLVVPGSVNHFLKVCNSKKKNFSISNQLFFVLLELDDLELIEPEF